MENASKALLIAGAILICILLIAVAMYIYNSASSSLDTAVSKMSSNDKDIYNSDIRTYVGDSVKGSGVKTLIDNIISNDLSNVGQTGKFISIYTYGNEGTNGGNNKTIESTGNDKASALVKWDKGSDLLDKCNAANFYDNGENTNANVNAATTIMQSLRGKINDSKNYIVTADYEQGVIIRIHIAQLND